MNKTPQFLIDGNDFNSYEEFTEYFSEKFLPYRWNGGLDAFSEILSSKLGLLY
ncbi:MAG TPA: hypothetical protein VEW65_05350 [Chryseolinea sp.]|nr:hypothetical protein [Chryseolinea sp.]